MLSTPCLSARKDLVQALDWWPNQLDLGSSTSTPPSDPMGPSFDYAKEFESLDLDAVIRTCTP